MWTMAYGSYVKQNRNRNYRRKLSIMESLIQLYTKFKTYNNYNLLTRREAGSLKGECRVLHYNSLLI